MTLKFIFVSCINGGNVGREFSEFVEDFLHYKLSSLPFKYLGLLMDVNPKKKWT